MSWFKHKPPKYPPRPSPAQDKPRPIDDKKDSKK